MYRDRFAHSPTGPLHMGSLLAAVASYLDARANHGVWLLRIEDIDPPREADGSREQIIQTLSAHGLHWDEEVNYQSEQEARHRQALTKLINARLAFYCNCTRRQLEAQGSRYPGTCLNREDLEPDSLCAIRLKTSGEHIEFEDLIQGVRHYDFAELGGDFIIHRRDQLIAYQLAVAVDDSLQEITIVVRGSDLLDCTPRQLLIQRKLGLTSPRYAHIPVLVNPENNKLSKQSNAPAIDNTVATDNLLSALDLLGQKRPPPGLHNNCDAILQWSARNWNLGSVPRTLSLPTPC